MAADGLRIWVFLILTLLGTCFASHSSARESNIESQIGKNFPKALNISEAKPIDLPTSSKNQSKTKNNDAELREHKNGTLVKLPDKISSNKENTTESKTGNQDNKSSNTSEGTALQINSTKNNDTEEKLPKTSEATTKVEPTSTEQPKTSEASTKIEPTPTEPSVNVTKGINMTILSTNSTEQPKTSGKDEKAEATSKKPKPKPKPKKWYQFFNKFNFGNWFCRWFSKC